jgi:hypothetical protein
MIDIMTNAFSRPIFWPLFLVAAGVLWLLASNGVISPNNLWVLVQFWPVLLIALGLDLLLRQRWAWAGNLVTLLTVTAAVLAVIFAPRLGLAAPAGSWWSWIPFSFSGTPGSGNVVTQTREVSGFNAVSFSAIGDLSVQQGAAEGLSVEAEDNVQSELRSEVRGGTLYISLEDNHGLPSVRPTRPIHMNLTVKQLNSVDLSGAGSMVVSQLKTDQLHADVSGAGGLKLDGLVADQLNSSLSGVGNLTASGKASRTSVDVSGVGGFSGDNLQSASANANISGTGSATLWVTDNLSANISGVGSVRYYGHPTVSKNVSGLGNVQSLGDK